MRGVLTAAPALACLLLLAVALAGPRAGAQPESPERRDTLLVSPQKNLLQLGWRDTEDVLDGALLPASPRVGEPLTVSVRVGALQGAPVDGPVVLTIRPAGERTGQTQVVTRDGERWVAEFVPHSPGLHVVSVGFRTTRNKVLHGEFAVHPATLPRGLAWGLGALLVLLVVAMGAFGLLRRARQEHPPAAGG
jgi:hypothetical protein